jgi:hypothetical protein
VIEKSSPKVMQKNKERKDVNNGVTKAQNNDTLKPDLENSHWTHWTGSTPFFNRMSTPLIKSRLGYVSNPPPPEEFQLQFCMM